VSRANGPVPAGRRPDVAGAARRWERRALASAPRQRFRAGSRWSRRRPARRRSGRYRGCIGRDDNAAGRRLGAGKRCEDFW